MNRKLTATQVKELAAFHKMAVRKRGGAKPARMKILGPEEAAKLRPGVILDHTVIVKRPPPEHDSRQ